MKCLQKNIFAIAALTSALTSVAYAQATRTWVSGVGDDANPCSRTAPCKTFAGAISKTAAHGEISVLDPGSFGAVTITKSITINGDGTLAGILASLTNGVVVNAGTNDIVTLRNLSINGAGSGINGIRYLAGHTLEIDSVAIYGFTQNGIDVNLGGSGNLAVRNSRITDIGENGVKIDSTAGSVSSILDHVSIQKTNTAIDSLYGLGTTWVSDCIITGNAAFGAHAEGGTVSLENCRLTSNGVAVQAEPDATVRLIGNDIFDNASGFGCGGGTLITNKNNRNGGNASGNRICKPRARISNR